MCNLDRKRHKNKMGRRRSTPSRAQNSSTNIQANLDLKNAVDRVLEGPCQGKPSGTGDGQRAADLLRHVRW